MAYYTDLFSPATYEAFTNSSQDISGFRPRQLNAAKQVNPGDKLVCYLTKLSRWIGVLEVLEPCFEDDAPIFYPESDPFVVRFKVKPVIWLPKDRAVPIHESILWDRLSFTKDLDRKSTRWTGIVRKSLNKLTVKDGSLLERVLGEQQHDGTVFRVDEAAYQRLLSSHLRREDKVVTVSIPEEDTNGTEAETAVSTIRESAEVQSLLAQIGEKMGFKIWIPKHDRGPVLTKWKAKEGSLLDSLPLNYNEPTLQTIEQIDVLWMKGRAIVRAFEVEHTTSVYSGILRMADLLALQPNMDIKLHIVAPEDRKQKVSNEIQRPVFSFIGKGPPADYCTYISYDSLRELVKNKHLAHLSDSVLEDYEEEAE